MGCVYKIKSELFNAGKKLDFINHKKESIEKFYEIQCKCYHNCKDNLCKTYKAFCYEVAKKYGESKK